MHISAGPIGLARCGAELPSLPEQRHLGVAVGVRRRHLTARHGAGTDEPADDAVGRLR